MQENKREEEIRLCVDDQVSLDQGVRYGRLRDATICGALQQGHEHQIHRHFVGFQTDCDSRKVSCSINGQDPFAAERKKIKETQERVIRVDGWFGEECVIPREQFPYLRRVLSRRRLLCLEL